MYVIVKSNLIRFRVMFFVMLIMIDGNLNVG